MNSYNDANEMFTTTRKRKLANNTYLEMEMEPVKDCRVCLKDEPCAHVEPVYAVRLHSTRILYYYPDGRVVLDSGGWQTVTTKARINEFLPRGWAVSQSRGVWSLSKRGHWSHELQAMVEAGGTFPYADRMVIHPDDTVSGEGDDPRAAIKLRAKLRKFSRAYMDAFWAGKVPAPSHGDCWGCLMRTDDGRHGVGGSDHILSHMEESYFVPSMLANAIKCRPVSRHAMHHIGVAWSPEEAAAQGLTLKRDDIADEQLRKALYRWMLAEVGLPT